MPHCTVDGHRLYFEWQGAHVPGREAVVFLHHGLGATGSWKDLPGRIGDAVGANALVYDRWGYGRSDPRPDFPFGFMEAERPVLGALLDALEVPRVHLVGHSDGGSIALLMAGKAPHRVGSLVVEAAHCFVEPETQAGIRQLVAEREAGRTPAWLERLHGERTDSLLAAWAAGWLSDAHAKWQIEDWLGYVTCPTLLIQGDADEYGTLEQVQAIVNRISGAESWILPACGHAPHAEQPEAFCARVIDHIAPNVKA